jgi:hypothetical protein
LIVLVVVAVPLVLGTNTVNMVSMVNIMVAFATGEVVGFARRGGSPPGWVAPSSSSKPSQV